MIESLIRISPSVTYWAAWLSIASTAALFIFFGGVGFMGPANDFLSIFQFLSLIPALFALQRILVDSNASVINIASGLAFVGILIFAMLQAALVVGLVTFSQTLRAILSVGSLIAIWWVAIGFVSLGGDIFPQRWAWLVLISGVFYLLIAVGFWISGSPEHPLAAVGFLVSTITVPWWLFWLSRLLREMPN